MNLVRTVPSSAETSPKAGPGDGRVGEPAVPCPLPRRPELTRGRTGRRLCARNCICLLSAHSPGRGSSYADLPFPPPLVLREEGFHADRAAGGHCHHRGADRPAAAGGAEG